MIQVKMYDTEAAINAMLYIIEKNAGSCDMHRIFKTLYFADREHLSRYGRSITNDSYIAMKYGPVPSYTDDILKALRGDSFFSFAVGEFTGLFQFTNRYVIKALKAYDPDGLSKSDIRCLDFAIEMTKGLSFGELTNLSHGRAWTNTAEGQEISIADMLRENNEEEGYALFIEQQIKTEKAFV